MNTTKVKLNGQTLVCREDDGNYWPIHCEENAAAIGAEWNGNHVIGGGFLFGSAIVGQNGSETEARENAVAYFTTGSGARIEILANA